MDSGPLNKLIFVYNADSGVRNALLDSMHKVLSPSTYECNLCDITFGLFSEKVNWKEFRLQFPMEMEFLHRDEFSKGYASKLGKNYWVILKSSTTNIISTIKAKLQVPVC